MSNDQVLNKARTKHDAGKFEEAIQLYQMYLIKNPMHLDANYLLGTAYAEMGKLEAAKKYLLKADKIMPYSPYVKVNLGNIYREQGDYESALISFIRALEIQSDFAEARQNIGIVIGMMEEGSSEKAATSCLGYALSCLWAGRNDEALSILVVGNHLDPQNAHIRYFMTILDGNQPEKALLEEFVQQEFDTIAPIYDTTLKENFNYSAPSQLVGMLKNIRGNDMHFDSIADLGCGTGLVGEAFKGHFGSITGIDLSEKMLETAKTKGVYDHLIRGEIVAELGRINRNFDLFVAADVFIYIGELDHLFEAVIARSNPGALLVFTTESGDGDSVALKPTGRYVHGREYISAVTQKHGCSIIDSRQIQLRKEGENWIMGDAFCVKVA
ncbi:MAG: tetratricopeptide repeat protein [Desulfuromonadaceae bacterium]